MVGEVAQEAGESAESDAVAAAVPDPVMREEPPEARVDEGDGHDGSEDGEAQEARELQHQSGPCEPTQEMRDAHNRCHRPPRPWCRNCVTARFASSPHIKGSGSEKELPVVSVDH